MSANWTPKHPSIRRSRSYGDPRFEVPHYSAFGPDLALDNARAIREREAKRRIMEHERRLQQQADEEGCGAVIGACLAAMGKWEEREPRAVLQTVTGGSLTEVFDAVAEMRAEGPWRVLEPPKSRATDPGRIVWDVVLLKDSR